MVNSSSADPLPAEEVCPICGGVGFVQSNLPVDDPNFGKLQVCVCRQDEVEQAEKERLVREAMKKFS